MEDYMKLSEKHYNAEVSRGERYLWDDLKVEIISVFREEMLIKH